MRLSTSPFIQMPAYPSPDLTELELPSTMTITHPDPSKKLEFELVIKPDEGACSSTRLLAMCLAHASVFPFFRTMLSLIGMYKGGSFKFTFNISQDYPHKPPKVKCIPKVSRVSSERRATVSLRPEDFAEPDILQIYHPNIDLEGNICLNILREDWKPVLNLNAIIVGLQFLFLEPNADDPLNKGASAFCRPYTRASDI